MADGPKNGDDESMKDENVADPNIDDGDGPEPLGAAAPQTIGRSPKVRNDEQRSRSQLRRVAVLVAVGLLVLVLLALTPVFIAGLKKTPRDRIGISYGGGPFEATNYQRIIQPGSGLTFNGFFDPLYLYPSDQVNYIISKQVGVGSTKNPDSVTAPTQDRVQVTYQVAVYFKLNTDLLEAFHEQLGLRYQAYTTKGWNALIQDTFRQQIENALQEETRRVKVADVFGNAQLLVTVQDRVQAKITQGLKGALGSPFFCAPTFRPGGKCGDPTFIIKKVEIPPSVAQAFQDNRTSGIRVLTKTNEIRQRQAEAQAIAALGLTGQEYATLRAIESGKISFWVLPDNAGVTLAPPNAGSSSPSGGSSPTSTTTTTTPGGDGG